MQTDQNFNFAFQQNLFRLVLGKGASGAAVENMNLMLGFEETAGLNL